MLHLLLLYVFGLFGLCCKCNNYVNKIWKKTTTTNKCDSLLKDIVGPGQVS